MKTLGSILIVLCMIVIGVGRGITLELAIALLLGCMLAFPEVLRVIVLSVVRKR